jgi:hypothetical protein
MEKRSCGECEHWLSVKDRYDDLYKRNPTQNPFRDMSNPGQCRKNPPVYCHGEESTTRGLWPVINEDEWCAEFKRHTGRY